MEAKDMEKKVHEHDEVIKDNILPRLDKVESVQAQFQQEVAAIKNDLMTVQSGQVSLEKGQKELELTMIKEGQLNREIMNENKDLSAKLLDHVLGKDERESKAETERKKKESQAKIDRKKQIWEIIGKVSVVLAGGTGILAVIIKNFS